MENKSNEHIGRDPALGIPAPADAEIFGNMDLAPYNDGGHPADGSNPSIPMPSFPPSNSRS